MQKGDLPRETKCTCTNAGMVATISANADHDPLQHMRGRGGGVKRAKIASSDTRTSTATAKQADRYPQFLPRAQ